MAKVTCEACGTSFLYNVVKDLHNCPVCGEPFWEEETEEEEIEEEVEKGLMYFYELATYKDQPEYDGVHVYCGECGKLYSLELDNFEKIVDKKYVILKDDIEVICTIGCGKKHKPRKIFYKEREPSFHLPSCPVCDSIMLKEISFGSKLLAAATMGGFATPYNRMTYECQNCGHLF